MLEVADLALDYPDFHTGYTLMVPAKALCALIGPSGGGKTQILANPRPWPRIGAVREAD